MRKLLGENKIAYLMINYVDTKRIPQSEFDKIINVDASQTKKFTEWIVKQYITDPSVEQYFPQLNKCIQAYIKFNDVVKDVDFKHMSIEEFINEIKTKVSVAMKPQIENDMTKTLNQFKVGTVLAHTIYVIPKDSIDANPILNNIANIPQDIVQYGTVIYVVGNTNQYVISFDADLYIDSNGHSIPLKKQNVDLWDNIFTYLYTKNHVQENIIACVDLFGEYFASSKLCKAIESNNPKEVFAKYYSNSNNKLLNLIVNTNSRAISDYSKYVDKFKNLGFGLKGTLLDIDLGSADLAEIKSSISEETYEANVKAHFKRTGQSFDSTTFEKIKDSFNSNATLYFILLRDADPTSGIFIESGNSVIGFINKSELAYLLNKFHSARKVQSILSQLNKETDPKYSEYESELSSLEDEVKKIIDNSKSLSHYIIV